MLSDTLEGLQTREKMSSNSFLNELQEFVSSIRENPYRMYGPELQFFREFIAWWGIDSGNAPIASAIDESRPQVREYLLSMDATFPREKERAQASKDAEPKQETTKMAPSNKKELSEQDMEAFNDENKAMQTSSPSGWRKRFLKSKRTCVVCGKRCIGVLYYNAVCCEGCKAFFYRTYSKGKQEKYRCSTNLQNCPITTSRSKCRACRLRKCLSQGMLPSLVQAQGKDV